MLHATADETYRQACHELTNMSQLAEQVCRYDLDELDVKWLERFNEEREDIGEPLLDEWTMEKVMEELESQVMIIIIIMIIVITKIIIVKIVIIIVIIIKKS